MKRLSIIFLVLLFAALVSAVELPKSVMLELSDKADNKFRTNGIMPALGDQINNLEFSIDPVFYIPGDPDKRQRVYDHQMNRWYELFWKNTATADDIAEMLKTGNDLLNVYVVEHHTAKLFPSDWDNYTMWGLETMRLPEAWELQTGNEEIIISTIDTGCRLDHPDLLGNIRINPGEDLNGNGERDEEDFNDIDDDGNGFIDDITGWDFVSAPTPPFFMVVEGEDYGPPDHAVYPDVVGHGTHVAGISASATDNVIGVPSASWNVTSMPLRAGYGIHILFGIILGVGNPADFSAAIQYAADNGTDIISISFGGSATFPGYQDAIDYAREAGIPVFAAAGNEDRTQRSYPAAYDNVIAVAATEPGDIRASFSNYGDWVDLAAPGVQIWSTIPDDNFNPGEYIQWDGTSMATPNAAAVAALVLSVNPDFGPGGVENILLSTCDPIDDLNPGYEGLLGAGRINAEEAIILAQGTDLITFEVEPVNPPIEIPAGGGPFTWEVWFRNNSMDDLEYDAWTEVFSPGEVLYTPIALYENMTLFEGDFRHLTPTEIVPFYAPPGDYTFYVKIGNYPDEVFFSDEFAFTVLGEAQAGLNHGNLADDWESYGWYDSEDQEYYSRTAESLPDNFVLHNPWPNPFNPSSTVAVTLPSSDKLSVNVYNVTGQLVAKLADGYFQSGYHSFTFDGTNLSSGIYFINAQVAGGNSEIRKVVLMK